MSAATARVTATSSTARVAAEAGSLAAAHGEAVAATGAAGVTDVATTAPAAVASGASSGAAQPAPVTVADLREAWAAMAGRARPSTWVAAADEDVVAVLGGVGSAGTTIVSLAIAHAHHGRTRVVECCAGPSTGLGTASETELGETSSRWLRGLRGHLLLERCGTEAWSPAELPSPPPLPGALDIDMGVDSSRLGPRDPRGPSNAGGPCGSEGFDLTDVRGLHHGGSRTGGVRTVLDVGWRSGELLSSGSWLTAPVSDTAAVVVVVPATEPGLRHLERTLLDLGPERAVAAVVGPRLRRWSPRLRAALPVRARQLMSRGRLVAVPVDRTLALRGVTDAALPASVLASGRELLSLVCDLERVSSQRVDGGPV